MHVSCCAMWVVWWFTHRQVVRSVRAAVDEIVSSGGLLMIVIVIVIDERLCPRIHVVSYIIVTMRTPPSLNYWHDTSIQEVDC